MGTEPMCTCTCSVCPTWRRKTSRCTTRGLAPGSRTSPPRSPTGRTTRASDYPKSSAQSILQHLFTATILFNNKWNVTYMYNTPKGLKVAKEDQKADRHDGYQTERGRDRHSQLLIMDRLMLVNCISLSLKWFLGNFKTFFFLKRKDQKKLEEFGLTANTW